MSRFHADKSTTIFPFKDEKGKWWWATSGEISFQVGDLSSMLWITIEQGFLTDLGSVPAAVRWLFNPADPAAAPAYVLHDWINKQTREALPNWLDGWSSQFAAAILYEALACNDVPLWSRKLQYMGVVLGIAKDEW